MNQDSKKNVLKILFLRSIGIRVNKAFYSLIDKFV